MTAKGTTKQGILDAALELFSVQGYEATSISQLAEAVGIRKASLYSHFENKQAILDALIQTTIGEYEKHSIFANADWDDPAFTKDKEYMTAEMAAQMFLGQIRYILHDPKISRARKCSPLSSSRIRRWQRCKPSRITRMSWATSPGLCVSSFVRGGS